MLLLVAGVTLEDPRTEDLSQEVRGFIFSKILVCTSQFSPIFVFHHTRVRGKLIFLGTVTSSAICIKLN